MGRSWIHSDRHSLTYFNDITKFLAYVSSNVNPKCIYYPCIRCGNGSIIPLEHDGNSEEDVEDSNTRMDSDWHETKDEGWCQGGRRRPQVEATDALVIQLTPSCQSVAVMLAEAGSFPAFEKRVIFAKTATGTDPSIQSPVRRGPSSLSIPLARDPM
ncbi:hypothetical protein ACFE04_022398 [Oxalis oulophora]